MRTPSQRLTPDAVLDLLTQLVDRSLVGVERREGAARYALLETTRDYARDRLREPFLRWQRDGLVRADIPARQLVWELFAPLQIPRLLHLHADASESDLAAARPSDRAAAYA